MIRNVEAGNMSIEPYNWKLTQEGERSMLECSRPQE